VKLINPEKKQSKQREMEMKDKEQIKKEAEMVKAHLEELKKDLLMWESLKRMMTRFCFTQDCRILQFSKWSSSWH